MMQTCASGLVVDSVSVQRGSALVLRSVSLSVAKGEQVAVLGRSGAGKSTLLRVIAGLQPVTSGSVFWDGRDLRDVPTHQRRFGFVFQDLALFPHLDVAGNIGYGLKLAGRSAAERRARVEELLALVKLEGFGPRRTAELSGGERQRVAVARALAPSPDLLLLDEPFTALDETLRVALAEEVAELLRGQHVTTISVTHDHHEARRLASRIVLLDDTGAHPVS